jgi:hypothetical protein
MTTFEIIGSILLILTCILITIVILFQGSKKSGISATAFEIDVAGTRYPARASVRPMYDPDRRRITA